MIAPHCVNVALDEDRCKVQAGIGQACRYNARRPSYARRNVLAGCPATSSMTSRFGTCPVRIVHTTSRRQHRPGPLCVDKQVEGELELLRGVLVLSKTACAARRGGSPTHNYDLGLSSTSLWPYQHHNLSDCLENTLSVFQSCGLPDNLHPARASEVLPSGVVGNEVLLVKDCKCEERRSPKVTNSCTDHVDKAAVVLATNLAISIGFLILALCFGSGSFLWHNSPMFCYEQSWILNILIL